MMNFFTRSHLRKPSSGFTRTPNALGVTAPSRDGFTLIEFVIIISIFAIVAGVGFFNIRGFQSDVSVTNLSHDLALLIRRAQSEGTSALSDPNNPSPTPVPRGLWFTYNTTTLAFDPEILVFDDLDQSGMYETGGLDIVVDRIQIQTQDRISEVKYRDVTDSWSPVTASFAVTFKRPFPEPSFFNPAWQDIRFTVTSPDGTLVHTVTLSGFGELAVQ
jgi:type II secretory pathway pseudopilin PulG